MTLQTLIIPIAGIVLGKKRGTYATLLYLIIGAIGIPVFSGFSGGIGILLGMTGGFLISNHYPVDHLSVTLTLIVMSVIAILVPGQFVRRFSVR